MKSQKLNRRRSFWENVLAILFGLLTVFLLGEAHENGIWSKWVTAVLVTIAPFGMVIYGYRALLGRWTFWIALGICLGIHGIGIWFLLGYVLIHLARASSLLWYPCMMAELFVLIVAVGKIHNSLSGDHERS